MTKSELLTFVALDTNLTAKQVEAALDGLRLAVQSALRDGQTVSYPGLGTFSREDRAARRGRNPQTGEAMDIAAKRVVKFRPAKGLNAGLGE